jgi:hypothetical protein
MGNVGNALWLRLGVIRIGSSAARADRRRQRGRQPDCQQSATRLQPFNRSLQSPR